jgi:hypothetical protein
MPTSVPPGQDMVFFVAGYDDGAPYGRTFELHIPTQPTPKEWHVDDFGMLWGGQKEFTDRIIVGFDTRLPAIVQQHLQLSDTQTSALEQHMKSHLQVGIPFAFLPLQDCVNLSISLIRTTITIQAFMLGIRGVGGAIDVATITKTDAFKAIHDEGNHRREKIGVFTHGSDRTHHRGERGRHA